MAKSKANLHCLLTVVIVVAIALALWYFFVRNRRQRERFSPSPAPAFDADKAYHLFENDPRPRELQDVSPSNLETLIQNRRKPLEMHDVKDFLPSPNPSTLLFGRDVRNPAVFIENRNITTRTRSRTAGSGNMILGDVPITPQRKGWFDSLQNETDLRTTSIGALIHPRQTRFRQDGDVLEVRSM